jgi:glutamyl-tRNA synthetase
VKKLTHMNGEYIRALPVEAFIEASRPWLTGEQAPWPEANFDPAVLARLAPLVQERVTVLSEVPAMVDFMFLDAPEIDDDAWAKAVIQDEMAVTILSGAIESFEGLVDDWTHQSLYDATQAIGDRVGRKLGKVQAPIRVAITGRRVGPPLFESLEVLGPEPTLSRLRSALERATAESS